MDTKKGKDVEAKVAFRGISPFGQTAESKTISAEPEAVPASEAIAEVLEGSRPKKVKDVVGGMLQVLEQLRAEAPDLELSKGAAGDLRAAVAAAAKEVLGKIKK